MTRTAAIMPSYDHGASNQPLLGETIGENFNRIATTHADREALVDRFTGLRWTYAQLHHDVLALAHGLIRLGIDKGDRVGIWAPNCPEWTILQYATAEIGAILVPINPAYRTDELADVRKYADGKLAHYKIPRYVRIVEDFPMTASGKVRKVGMREAAVSMLGLREP
jgi:fatty-acyl-CoA synthase